EALINCLAYIDLNPVRAKIVKRPEDYRWSGIGYRIFMNNKGEIIGKKDRNVYRTGINCNILSLRKLIC
ncbi:MAG: hypothetical protein PVH61_19770, partial [Candidatus Aminicenantes bacterium]